MIYINDLYKSFIIEIHSRKSKKIDSCYFYAQNQMKRRKVYLPCPHYDIKIVQRSNRSEEHTSELQSH